MKGENSVTSYCICVYIQIGENMVASQRNVTFSEALGKLFKNNDSEYEADGSDNSWEPTCPQIGELESETVSESGANTAVLIQNVRTFIRNFQANTAVLIQNASIFIRNFQSSFAPLRARGSGLLRNTWQEKS